VGYHAVQIGEGPFDDGSAGDAISVRDLAQAVIMPLAFGGKEARQLLLVLPQDVDSKDTAFVH
jgi:hypothetical protein